MCHFCFVVLGMCTDCKQSYKVLSTHTETACITNKHYLYNILSANLSVFIIVCSTVCLRDMLKYTASVREWMSADPQNIIAIHCKGGKGDAKDPYLFTLSVHDLFEQNKDIISVYCVSYIQSFDHDSALFDRTHRYYGVHLAY